ncbi:hypothetical protein GCM10009760_21180 [Kitasatospora kazusensis]|uniref:GNAT family N-acetyltransferase n=1 Tax=Kitasatospora kazusensis TaxID=407974 RepID=A0ABN2ZAD1_9ACTN
MSDIRVRIHTSVLELDAERWARVSRGLGAGYGYRKIAQLQQELPSGSWVVAAYRGSELLAYAFACAATADAPKFVQPGLVLTEPMVLRAEYEPDQLKAGIEDFKKSLGGAGAPGLDPVRRFLLAETQPALVVRNMQDSRIVVDPDTGPELQARLVESVLRALVELAEDQGLRTVCFPYATAPVRDQLAEAGVLPWESCRLSTTARYRLDGLASFDDYLARLPSRRRREVRREIRRFAESGIEVSPAGFDEVIERVAVLEANNFRKYGWDITVEAILAQRRAWRAAFGEELKVLVGRKGSDIVASLVFRETAELLELFSVGFDYSAVGGEYCYFNLSCYLPIRHAIERSIPTVEVGAEAVRGKYLRGCSVEQLYFCISRPDGVTAPVRDWLALIDRQNSGFLSSVLGPAGLARELAHA